MNFDYEYITTAADVSNSHGINFDWKIFCFCIIGILVVLVIVFSIFLFRNKAVHKKVTKKGNGAVFCKKCNNEFDAGLSRCPYCKNRNNQGG